MAEAGAVEALRHRDRVAARRAANREGIDSLTAGLRARGHEVADSQTNFVYARFDSAADVNRGLLERGVIVRPVFPPEWLRISVGAPDEIDRFFAALDDLAVS